MGRNLLTAKRACLPPSLPACRLSPCCGCPLPSPSLFLHSELVLIAPHASSAIGVAALISKLPSQGEQARVLAATSRAATAVTGGEAAVLAGFVPTLPSFPPRDHGSPTLGVVEGAVGRWARAGDGCGGQGDGCKCGRFRVGLSL